MAAAPSLGVCARALAEDRPEVAGVLRGAAYAAYRRGSTGQSSPDKERGNPSVNYLLQALREAGDIITAALGEERRQRLRTEGAALTHGRSRVIRTGQHRRRATYRPHPTDAGLER